MQKAPLTPRQQLLPDCSVKANQAGGREPPFFDGLIDGCPIDACPIDGCAQDSVAAFLGSRRAWLLHQGGEPCWEVHAQGANS